MEENLEISKSLLLMQSKFFLFLSLSLSLSPKRKRNAEALSLFPLSLFTFKVSLFRPTVSFERDRERGYDLLEAFRISL
jgi:hypothetical protein